MGKGHLDVSVDMDSFLCQVDADNWLSTREFVKAEWVKRNFTMQGNMIKLTELGNSLLCRVLASSSDQFCVRC